MIVQVWPTAYQTTSNKIHYGKYKRPATLLAPGFKVRLTAGESIALVPGIDHTLYPESAECIIGGVTIANDHWHEDFFINPRMSRYALMVEDKPLLVKLVSAK